MHRTLSAVALAAFLLSPSSLLDRLWDLVSGPAPAHVSPTRRVKEGPGLDPNGGITATPPTTEAGPGLDPFGHS
jgi:hypothetical protein